MQDLRGLARMHVDGDVCGQQIRGLQQLVEDREHPGVNHQIDDGGRLGEQRIQPLRAQTLEVVAAERSAGEVRCKLSLDPIEFARADKVGKHDVAVGTELLDERLAAHADTLPALTS
jgi:hypothetical protein